MRKNDDLVARIDAMLEGVNGFAYSEDSKILAELETDGVTLRYWGRSPYSPEANRFIVTAIAALREARDALATPQGDIPDDAYNVPTGTPEQIAADYAALGLATPQDDADADWRAWDDEMATPDGQAKLARLATDAAPAAPQRAARLTERMVRTLKRAAMAGDGMVYGGRYGEVNGRSAQALVKRGLMEPAYSYDCGMFRITDAGRAALRDARDDARDGGGER